MKKETQELLESIGIIAVVFVVFLPMWLFFLKAWVLLLEAAWNFKGII